MSSKSDTGSLNVVDLASSDEEENPRLKTKTSIPSSQTLPTPTLNESRSFWKAGAYDVVASTSQLSSQGYLEHARIHPKFLHTNATSHKWAFGAIAELLDNAVDEICNGATYVKLDKIYNRKDNSPALLFQDNGGGMDPEGMRKCMSLGYSSKKTNTTIGQYGNGFKTSTMRLGADAIVFSRKICGNHATQSIGLLSYTFLRRTGQDDIVVPMVDFDLFDHGSQPIIYGSQNDWTNNLKTILDWSPFSSRDDLMLQFEDIGPHGTKVIVYNLWLDDDGLLELDFDYDDEDIRLNEEGNTGNFLKVRRELLKSHISYCYRFSLRAYVSILYLRRFSGFQIILRGKPVQQFSIVDGLKFPKVILYRPQLAIASKEATVETTIGFVKEAPALQVHGVNIYHKNRLIMPFCTVVPSGSSRGQGVVGVLEANFIEPAHDKQDFERTALFIRLEAKLKQIIVEYWVKSSHLIGLPRPRLEKPKTSQAPTSHPPIGFSNMQKNLPHSQSFVGLPANTWAPFEGNERHDTTPASYYPVRDAAEPPCSRDPVRQSVRASDNEVADISEPSFVDTICDENIQLFMRSENYRQKEAELKKMVEELEGELEEKRRKCLQLALSIQIQREQKSLNP